MFIELTLTDSYSYSENAIYVRANCIVSMATDESEVNGKFTIIHCIGNDTWHVKETPLEIQKRINLALSTSSSAEIEYLLENPR